jgi:hypothetical protein
MAWAYHAAMGNPGADWSDAEVGEVVGDYLAMLAAEVTGHAYSKADHRRALLGRLDPSRTPQAVEFKHANISAAMIELGLPYIRGYKPRGNYQAALETEIRRRIGDMRLLEAVRAAPTGTTAGQLELTDPPARPPRRRVGRHIDYGALQEENRRRGAHGEQLVVAFERHHLHRGGRGDLADQVRWAAKDDGDGLGYDVLSFSLDGRARYIEVKATAFGPQTPFYMSSAELEFARSHTRSFALYRVYDVLVTPRVYVLEGDITGEVDLVPVTYRAQVKSGTAEQTTSKLPADPAGGDKDPTPPPERRAQLHQEVAASRRAQGLPATIEDPALLDRIAALMVASTAGASSRQTAANLDLP